MTKQLKTIKIFTFVFLFFFIQVGLTVASEPSIYFERINIDNGLPQNSGKSIIEDKKGFLWIATQEGLARYDGYSFKVFKYLIKDNNSLTNNYINTIFEDKVGNLWVGSTGGLNYFNTKTETFTRFKHDNKNPKSITHDTITSITEDNKGNIWVGTKGGGLNCFNSKTNTFTHYRHDINNATSLSHDNITDIAVDNRGTLWVGTSNGLNRFEPSSKHFIHFKHDKNNPKSISHNNVRAITDENHGNIWIGTNGGGLNLFNLETESFLHFKHDSNNPKSISHNSIEAITLGNQDNLWIGTNGGGLNLLDLKTQNFTHYKNKASDPFSLSKDDIHDVTVDSQGNLWVGTDGGGVNRYHPKTQRFTHFKHDTTDINTLSENNMFAITEDSQNNIWLGTNGGGLNHLDVQTENFSHFKHDTSDNTSISHNRVTTITEDNQDHLWIGTWGGGLNRLDLQTQKFTHFKHDASNPNSLSQDDIWVTAKDKNEHLWIGTWEGGLNRFDESTKTFIHYKHDPTDPNSLSHDTVFAISKDSQGYLWVGTWGGGLNRFDYESKSFRRFKHDDNNPRSLSHDSVGDIHEDSQGNLWVGTWGGGLNMLQQGTNDFIHYDESDGLPNNVIYRIEEDNEGNIWVSTNNGLSRFDPKSKLFRNFNVADGLQSNEFNSGASMRSSSGAIYFGGINGINSFYPDELTDISKPPTVVFTDFLLDNLPVSVGSHRGKINSDFLLEQAIHSTKELILSHRQKLVTFEFSTLHFTNQKMNQYAYKMEGFDKDWIKTDYKNRRATYTTLPNGEYVLRVKASNPDGVWEGEATSLKITVLPPPWKTWWAYSIYILLFSGMLITFIRAQRKKVLYERDLGAQLELKVAERTLELQKAYTQLEEVSLTDQLTGLKNRRFLLSNIDNDIALILRNVNNKSIVKNTNNIESSDMIFFIIDLDHFKQVNDIYGHTAGDAVLIQIKGILKQVFRETDYLVRWGGEEFLVIARFTDRNIAAELAERLRKSVANHDFDIGEGRMINKTCSIGFACYPFLQHETTALEWSKVVDVADHCLYAAKKSSRNAWVGIDSTHTCIKEGLFSRVTEQTQVLIETKELRMVTSIPENKTIIW